MLIVRIRCGCPTLPYEVGLPFCLSAQLSCHDAPIFRLLLKIAREFDSIQCDFLNFSGGSIPQQYINQNIVAMREPYGFKRNEGGSYLQNDFPMRSHPSWLFDVTIRTA